VKILITGGTGFIGRHLLEALSHTQHHVDVVARDSRKGSELERKYKNVTFIRGDILNNFDFLKYTKNVDVVIHLYWSNLPRNSSAYLKQDLINSVSYGIDLLDACAANGVSKFIFASSGGTVYGIPQASPLVESTILWPISSYGLTKAIFEKYLGYFESQCGMQYAILRLSNVYGPGQNLLVRQGVISHWLNDIIKIGEIELWGDGEAIRDYIYISDVVQSILLVLNIKDSVTLNISSNTGISLNQIIDIFQNKIGLDFKVNQKSFNSTDVPINVLDNQLANKKLNWQPTVELVEGIRATYDYLLKLNAEK
jgi:UDP-glucose 4-epimerase